MIFNFKKNVPHLYLVLLSFIWVIFTALAYGGTNYSLKATINGLKEQKISVYNYKDIEAVFVDSITVSQSGSFSYDFKNPDYIGFYKLKLNEKANIDFIFNKENVSFTTSFSSLQDSIKFTESKENKIYYDYLKFSTQLRNKFQLLSNLKRYYQPENIFYKELETEISKIPKENFDYTDYYAKTYSNTFASRIIRTQLTAYSDMPLNEKDFTDFQRGHYWDYMDFSDTLILNSQTIANKIFEYLSMYRTNNMQNDELADVYKKPIEVILTKANVNETVYKAVLNKILRDVEKIKIEKLYLYISENYMLPSLCSNDSLSKALANKIENIKRVAIGSTAPDIVMDKNGKLSDISSKYTLVVFWSSWCGHCTTALEDLKDMYSKYKPKGLEILAVSVDSDSLAWKKAIAERKYNWLQFSEVKGWIGPTVLSWNVSATPSWFLLDNNKTIIGKPYTVAQLKGMLEGKL